MNKFKAFLVFCILTSLFAVKAIAAETDDFHYIGIELPLTTSKVDESSVGNHVPRVPAKQLSISIDGTNLYLYGQFNDITLSLIGDDCAEYTENLSAGAYVVSLPSYLSGIYELQLNDGVYLYTCTLNL